MFNTDCASLVSKATVPASQMLNEVQCDTVIFIFNSTRLPGTWYFCTSLHAIEPSADFFIHAINSYNFSCLFPFWQNWCPWLIGYQIRLRSWPWPLIFKVRCWICYIWGKKWSDCHETKTKIDWILGLKCALQFKCGPWIFKVKYEFAISGEKWSAAMKWKANKF